MCKVCFMNNRKRGIDMQKYIVAGFFMVHGFGSGLYATLPSVEKVQAKADEARQGVGLSLKDVLAGQCKDGSPVCITINGKQLVANEPVAVDQNEKKQGNVVSQEVFENNGMEEAGENTPAMQLGQVGCFCYDNPGALSVDEWCVRMDQLLQSTYWGNQDEFVRDMYFAMASSNIEAKALLCQKIKECYGGELLKFLFFVQTLSNEWYGLADLLKNPQLIQSTSDEIRYRLDEAQRQFNVIKHIWFFTDLLLDEA